MIKSDRFSIATVTCLLVFVLSLHFGFPGADVVAVVAAGGWVAFGVLAIRTRPSGGLALWERQAKSRSLFK